MHGHVHGVGQQTTSQFSGVASAQSAAKTAAAQEASATRRKLMRAAEEMGATTDGVDLAAQFGPAGSGTAKGSPSVGLPNASASAKTYQWGSAVSHGVETSSTGGSVSVWV